MAKSEVEPKSSEDPRIQIVRLEGQLALLLEKQTQTNNSLIEIKGTIKSMNEGLPAIRHDLSVVSNKVMEQSISAQDHESRIEALEKDAIQNKTVVRIIGTILSLLTVIGVPQAIQIITAILNRQ